MLYALTYDDFANSMMEWYVWVPMLVILLGLIGVIVFMRMKKKDDDE
jgi:hypothetical protein